MKNHRSFFIQEQTTKSFVAAKVNYFLVVYSVINYSETKFNQLLLSIVSYIYSLNAAVSARPLLSKRSESH